MQHNHFLVSIIIPMYNSENYIGATIESILNQNYHNIEVLVVDDGSTDSSKRIVNSYVGKDERIRYIYQHNEGAPAARNRGLDLSKGEYIIFFDADDTMLPGAISFFVEKSRGNDIIIGDYINVDENGVPIKESGNVFFKNVIQNPVANNDINVLPFFDPLPGNKMFKRELLSTKKIKFSSLKIGQDLNFYLKVVGNKPTFVLIEDVVFQYRNHIGSISQSYSKSVLDIIKSFEDVETHKFSIYENNKTILETLKLNHFILQLFKVPYVKDKRERVEIYSKLKFALLNIHKPLINHEMVVMNTRKAKWAIRFGDIYTSNFLQLYLKKCKIK